MPIEPNAMGKQVAMETVRVVRGGGLAISDCTEELQKE